MPSPSVAATSLQADAAYERKLQPVYDAIEAYNTKASETPRHAYVPPSPISASLLMGSLVARQGSLKLANAALSKYKGDQLLRVLKAVLLQRSDRMQESLVVRCARSWPRTLRTDEASLCRATHSGMHRTPDHRRECTSGCCLAGGALTCTLCAQVWLSALVLTVSRRHATVVRRGAGGGADRSACAAHDGYGLSRRRLHVTSHSGVRGSQRQGADGPGPPHRRVWRLCQVIRTSDSSPP